MNDSNGIPSALVDLCSLGFRVIPVHGVNDDGTCTCGNVPCASGEGKHPRISGWQHAGTTDLHQIARWAASFAVTNWGVVADNLVVIDVDPRNGGDDSMVLLRHMLPPTLTQDTGGGGVHYVYRLPEGVTLHNGKKSWQPGVDVLSGNTQFLVAPSCHKSGGVYSFRDLSVPVVDLPPDVLSVLLSGSSSTAGGSTTANGQDLSDVIAGVPEGERDNALFRACCRWRRFMSRAEVEVMAQTAAARCVPPFPPEQASKCVEQAYKQDHDDVEPWMIEWAKQYTDTATGSLFVTVMELAAEAGTLTVENDRPAWEPVDVGALLAALDDDPTALDTDPPTILTRADGASMFYAGQLNGLHGRSESGKSWVAIFAAVQELEQGNPVLYLDFESDAKDVLGRLLVAGAKTDQIRSGFTYVSPHSRYTQDEVYGIARMIVDGAFTLTVVDGVTDAMSLFGFDGRHEREFSDFKNALLLPLCLAGSAVVTIDHVAEGSDGDKAIGTQHKRASVRGAALLVEVVKPFGRGRQGVARLTVAKDRRGWVRGSAERQTANKDVAGMFVLDATALEFEDRETRLSFVLQSEWNTGASADLGRLSSETEKREQGRIDALLAVLAENDGANTTQLATLTGWSNKGEVAKVAADAADMGLIEIRKGGPGKATTHYIIEKADD
ncbi:bifunctional DNA primase/polymerase [Pimelobacter simplex]|uniref:bifunctional DNA primase/polymerase n=1 Tax=Nocardioides simplex TaxID=2045 RepID=UPI0038051B7C